MATKTKAAVEEKPETMTIPAPNLMMAEIRILGTSPLVQHKFSKKVGDEILQRQMEKGGKKRKAQTPRDPDADFEQAAHRMEDGSYGIPAPAFRCAMISACRVAGFVMSKAKLSVWVEPDGFDVDDGTPLVRLDAGEPERNQSPVRLASGVASIAIRPMWREWGATVRVTYDGDQFSEKDIYNLMLRAGLQVGIGEGRNDSKKSNGLGWGAFRTV